MEHLQTLFLYMSFTAVLFLLIGLYKPWIMLWWEDVQNRRKVVKIYGIAALASYALHWGIHLIK